MTEFTARVQSLGRVVIPEQVRILEKIEQGDIVTLGVFTVRKAAVIQRGEKK